MFSKILLLLVNTSIILCRSEHEVIFQFPESFEETSNEIYPDERITKTTTQTTGDSLNGNCGGVLFGPEGRIEYKAGIPYANGERCTWTIHGADTHFQASTITFTIQQNGLIQSVEDYLKVGFFLDSDYKTLGNFQEVTLSHNSMNRSVQVPGPVAFLRFSSDNSINGLGFIVSYVAHMSNVSLPFRFSNYFFDGYYGVIEYPRAGQFYSQLERVTFSLRVTKTGYLALKYFGGNCGTQKDFLTVYKRFTPDYQEQFSVVQQFCNSSITTVPNWQIRPQEEYLITLHTSISGNSTGFQFIWTYTQ